VIRPEWLSSSESRKVLPEGRVESAEGGRYRMKLRGICLDSSSAFIRVM